MKYHFLTLIITLSMLLTVACDNGSTRENLEHAELAIEQKDYQAASATISAKSRTTPRQWMPSRYAISPCFT